MDLQAQLVPGTFAHAVHHWVDALDLSAFDAHYRNDVTGATAHSPTMLLKAVSSRTIERACRDNVLFIALTGDAKPHFTTIADFVSRSRARPPLSKGKEKALVRASLSNAQLGAHTPVLALHHAIRFAPPRLRYA